MRIADRIEPDEAWGAEYDAGYDRFRRAFPLWGACLSRVVRMAGVAVCGSVNMDVFGYVPRLPQPGETLHGSRLAHAAGGKGANQAVAAARSGATVHFFGAAGTDAFGDEVVAGLAADGIDLAGLRRVDEPTGVALILVEDGGENEIVVLAGANDTVGAPTEAPGDVAVWLTQAEVPVAAVEGTLALARSTGATAVINAAPGGRLPPELVSRFDIAIVNELELEGLGDHRPACVILTLGAGGARILPHGPVVPAIPADVVDTTGAGDALTGALVAALAERRSLDDALRWGMAAASLSIERYGCQPAMPTRAEIGARLRP
ncbi:MAG: ribokinase [Gaiellales bacterium]|nr:ribokinase [Gaiellales bacterium]